MGALLHEGRLLRRHLVGFIDLKAEPTGLENVLARAEIAAYLCLESAQDLG